LERFLPVRQHAPVCFRRSDLKFLADVVVFHAGTVKVGDLVQTSGGRVIAVSAYAPSLQEALDRVYEGVEKVNFEGKVYRRDIGHRYVLQRALTERHR
jgi:phosphoribosylamine-glycine ligase